MKNKAAEDQSKYSLLLRFLLWIGRPFGLAFVPQNNVQVIYTMGQYSGVRGPGLIYHNRITEKLGTLIPTNGQFLTFLFRDVISQDNLPVTFELKAIVKYHPNNSSLELASILTELPRKTHAELAEIFLRWVLLKAANKYNAVALTQNSVSAQIERLLDAEIPSEIEFLGLQVGQIRIMRVVLPTGLTERHEIIAQRRAGVLAGTEFHPFEIRRQIVTEVLENLSRSRSAESLININEMLESYVTEHKAELSRRIIDQTVLDSANTRSANSTSDSDGGKSTTSSGRGIRKPRL